MVVTGETKSEPKILVRRYSGSARLNHCDLRCNQQQFEVQT